ncbi:MAG: organomercurial lyase [Candidatus Dormibacteraceae bacterium]
MIDQAGLDGWACQLESIGPIARRRKLPKGVATLHSRILRWYARTGLSPTPDELQAWADELGLNLPRALTELAHADLIQAELDAHRVLGAYPFVSESRGHRVDIEGGPTVHAYCAVDALGMSAMLKRPVTITSRDPGSGAEIRVQVRGGKATWEPTEAVVTVPASTPGDDRQAGDCACPAVNFHTSAETAHAYERAHHVSLEVLAVDQAHRLGAAVFGSLLDADPQQEPGLVQGGTR